MFEFDITFSVLELSQSIHSYDTIKPNTQFKLVSGYPMGMRYLEPILTLPACTIKYPQRTDSSTANLEYLQGRHTQTEKILNAVWGIANAINLKQRLFTGLVGVSYLLHPFPSVMSRLVSGLCCCAC